jgi:stringent starvation protein B
MSESSTKPYLIRAIHEWCADQGYTPYISVSVDERTIVPRAFVKAGEIVLNISVMATNRLKISNDLIEFQARFGGAPFDLSVPIENVAAIYARETGHGMAFDVVKQPATIPDQFVSAVSEPSQDGDLAKESSTVVAFNASRPSTLRAVDSVSDKTSTDPDDPTKPTRPKLTRIK